jgi:hypothetical protein
MAWPLAKDAGSSTQQRKFRRVPDRPEACTRRGDQGPRRRGVVDRIFRKARASPRFNIQSLRRILEAEGLYVRSPPTPLWTEAEVRVLRWDYGKPRLSVRSIAAKLGRTPNQIMCKAAGLSLKWPLEFRANLGSEPVFTDRQPQVSGCVRSTWRGRGDMPALQNYPPQVESPQPCSLAGSAEEATMPKGLNLRCAAGKSARIRLQGKGAALAPGQALVLLPKRPGETNESPVAYRAPLRQALIDERIKGFCAAEPAQKACWADAGAAFCW